MDKIEKVIDILGGGWLSLVLMIVFGIIVIWLISLEKKIKRDQAIKKTNQERVNDQAETSTVSQETEENWNDAQNEIDEIRNRLR